jgi:hypothetical protein
LKNARKKKKIKEKNSTIKKRKKEDLIRNDLVLDRAGDLHEDIVFGLRFAADIKLLHAERDRA